MMMHLRKSTLALSILLLSSCSSNQSQPAPNPTPNASPGAASMPSPSPTPKSSGLIPPTKGTTIYFYLSKGGSMPGQVEFKPKCNNAGTCAEKSHAEYIFSALKDYMDLGPIHFVEIDHPPLANDATDTHHPYIYYADDGPTDLTSSTADSPANYLPWLKDRDHLIRLAQDSVWTTAPIGPLLSPNGATKITLHETGHALGRFHEHTRNDRDSYLSVNLCCTDFGQAFDLHNPGPDGYLAPYDRKSIMHYSSEQMCVSDPNVPVTNAPGYFKHCVCLPMLSKNSNTGLPDDPAYHLQNQPANASPKNVCPANFAESGYLLPENPGFLSLEDLNILFLMYPARLGSNQPGSVYGSSAVGADFDGDGYADLAVGAPGAANTGGPHSGLVYVYKGTSLGLVPWRVLDSSGISPGADRDRFGAALAAIDLDGDGKAELFVGAPGKAAGAANAHSGGLFVFQGSRTGPVPLGADIGFFHEENLGSGNPDAEGNLFGASLVAGTFNGKPGVAIGAPGENLKAGSVMVLQWAGPTPSKFATLGKQQAAGNEFGASLATGDVDGDGVADLVVGAPGANKAIFFQGTAQGFTSQVELHRIDKPNAPNFSRFGQSVAVGRFSTALPAPRHQIAVGSPGNAGEDGAVWIFRIDPADQGTFKITKNIFLTETTDAAGGNMGASLAAADLNQDEVDDLIVGAPAATQGQGGVLIYAGGSKISDLPGAAPWAYVSEPTGHGNNVAGDGFGTALAFGDFNHDGPLDLTAGASGKAAPSSIVSDDTKTAGAIYMLKGLTGGNPPTGNVNPKKFSSYLDQEFVDPRKN